MPDCKMSLSEPVLTYHGTHMRAMSQKILWTSICKISLEIIFLKLVSHLPVANKLNQNNQNITFHNISSFHSSVTGLYFKQSQIARFTWPTWGPPGSCRPQVGPMLVLWILLSGMNNITLILGKMTPFSVFYCDDSMWKLSRELQLLVSFQDMNRDIWHFKWSWVV